MVVPPRVKNKDSMQARKRKLNRGMRSQQKRKRGRRTHKSGAVPPPLMAPAFSLSLCKKEGSVPAEYLSVHFGGVDHVQTAAEWLLTHSTGFDDRK